MKTALHICLFLVGMTAVAASLRGLDVMPFNGVARTKLGHLLQHEGEYDTLFVGSSRMHYGLIPNAFDQAFAKAGRTSSTYSLGLAGYRPNDFDVLIDWLLRNRTQRWKRAFIELHTFQQSGFDSNWMSWRQIHLHTPQTLFPRLATALGGFTSAPPAWEVACSVCMHTLTNALSIGRAPTIIDNLITPPSEQHIRDSSQTRDHGWRSALDAAKTNASLRKAHDKWLTETDHEPVLAMKRAGEVPDHQRTGLPYALIRAMADKLHAAGIEVCFVVMPTMQHSFWGADGVPVVAEGIDVIDLDDPAAHADVFDPRGFHDHSHLNPRGALSATTALARTYAALLTARGE